MFLDRNKQKFIIFYLSFFFTLLCLFGCQNTNTSTNPEQLTITKEQHQQEFDVFVHELFINEVTSDGITLNYTLANPEQYGIEHFTPTFGNYSLAYMKESLLLSENYMTSLKKFDYTMLSNEQQIIYDLLYNYFLLDINTEDLLLYNELLRPTTGLQAQLPVLLAEYNFYDETDVEQYLLLLPCIQQYFKGICDFETQKADAGLFMTAAAADTIIAQCKDFIANPKDNYLITIFNDRVEQIGNFSKAQISEWKKQNKAAILQYVIPAYEQLIITLTSLKEKSQNQNGLYYFKNGKDYYKYLVKVYTGSNRTIKELKKLIESYLTSDLKEMSALIDNDTELYNKANFAAYPSKDPKKIVSYLQTAITQDFPSLETVNCTIKYVHPSLEEYLSPAFYLTPPIDNFTENSIYINTKQAGDMSDIFTTIAHEGYPGHLYQNVYFRQQNPNPIRNILGYQGYSEGWATYCELYSYYIAGLEESVASLLSHNISATLCMYARVDIGIHYDGWTKEQTAVYLSKFGIKEESIITEIWKQIVGEPGNYLKYTVGYLEIMELKNQAMTELKEQFVLKEFHEFLLKMGPVDFDTMQKYYKKWAASIQK